MRESRNTKQFEKDLKRMRRRRRDLSKLRAAMSALVSEEAPEERYRDHALIGRYKGLRECHIEPDWLLMYLLLDDAILFVRTGTHADLFE